MQERYKNFKLYCIRKFKRSSSVFSSTKQRCANHVKFIHSHIATVLCIHESLRNTHTHQTIQLHTTQPIFS